MFYDVPDKDTVFFGEPDESGLFSLTFFAFSTLITVKAYMPVDKRNDDFFHAPQQIAQALVYLCRRYERLLSRTLKGSDIFRLNTAQGLAVEVDADTWQALRQGQEYSLKSEGLFDITMGGITRLWDFSQKIIPDREVVTQALEHVDYKKLKLFTHSEEGSTHYYAQLLDPKSALDLGGTAKGFIADKMNDLMRQQGVAGAFVNLGGNVAVFGGRPDGQAWRIGIQSPFESSEMCGVISLVDGSVVTSGLYERCFTFDDVLYHHILDRSTGFPVESDIAGVSVVASSSADADGYSTILFALGSKEAIRFVESLENIEAVIIDKENRSMYSSGFSYFDQV